MAGLDFVLKSDEAKIEWEKLLTGKNKGMRRLSIAARFVEKAREIEVNRPVTKQHLRPIVLGQTVEAHPVTHKINFLTAA